jgi:hypothetical protein
VLIAVGALTSHCYDYFDVTVLDADGRKTCAATVTATNGREHFELKSCYYAPLTDGTWTFRAALSGYPDAVSTARVEHPNDCTRHVQSVELTLHRSVAPAPVSATLPPAPMPPPEPPITPPPSTTSPLPEASHVTSPSATTPAAPSVGVFPNQSNEPRP